MKPVTARQRKASEENFAKHQLLCMNGQLRFIRGNISLLAFDQLQAAIELAIVSQKHMQEQRIAADNRRSKQ